MRVSIALAAAAASLLTLSACATVGDGETAYAQAYEKLNEDCRQRGGILSATGAQTARPATDYVCRILDTGSGLTRQR